MSQQNVEAGETPQKSSKMPIIIGIVLSVIGGGAGFYAASSGLILSNESQAEVQPEEVDAGPKMAFLDVDPLTISLPPTSPNQYLRFRANLEVPARHSEEVAQLMPRVIDVMNSYLRALAVEDLQEPSALMRLRSQLLRRIQVVAGPGRINDLLVMEFVLN